MVETAEVKVSPIELNQDIRAYQWALPEKLGVPTDVLKCRLDFYQDAVMLYFIENGVIVTRMVSARDIVMALLSEVDLGSGLLPDNTLWWSQGKQGVQVGLWRSPQVWRVALVTRALQAPRRFKIPMPGLIFVCSPAQSPRIFAAKKRPKSPKEHIYHAPLFNLFRDGSACPGTHKFPAKVADIPESFFTSFFSMEAQFEQRSKKHPQSLLSLWEELDGKRRYPMGDLIKAGILEDIMK
jgi:hypothetical protein